MSLDIIQERLTRERPATAAKEHYLLREILQEIALSGLARGGFFEQAAFHGGSSLRILHGLRRFSEDLDFILKRPNAAFAWSRFAEALQDELSLFGVTLEVKDRSEVKTVKALFLKDQSLGKVLRLRYPLRPEQKLTIKLEIDTRPPAGSGFETRYVNFPVPFSLLAQDLASGFAMKLHALLCRPYVKGRDWFDLLWYVQRRVLPNTLVLDHALAQQGPWQGAAPGVDGDWLERELLRKIVALDWAAVRRDVERFLDEPERRGLAAWGVQFFSSQVEVLTQSIAPR